MRSGNARRWICTMVLASTALPEKTSCLHLTLAAKAASMSVTNSNSVVYRRTALCEQFLYVCVGSTHLHLHISQTDDVALIVMAHLSGYIDSIVNFDRLRVTIFFLPWHSKGLFLFVDCHFECLC